MQNFINIKGRNIALTDEQIKEIKKSFDLKGTELKSIPAGETFKLGEYEFFVLEQSGDTTAVLLKNLLCESEEFGKNNNYADSNVDDCCREFAEIIADIIGEENLVEHTVDLTADDGLKDYGEIKRKMSLLTAQLYRRYVYTIDKHKLNKWWWLATAFSTPTHGYSSTVKCVSPVGYIISNCYYDNSGVRPFCILKSNIFVSK